MSEFQFHTFGCKVNTYDTGLLQKRLGSKPASSLEESISASQRNDANVSSSAQPPIHILNTCAVTAEATKEAVKLVRKLKSQNPDSLIIVTGCAAQVDTDQFANLDGVDLVVANSHKGELKKIIEDHQAKRNLEKVFRSNIFKKEDLEGGGGFEESHSRAFLKIQDGCNSFCSFCIIPYARGKSRSLTVQELVDRVNQMVEKNYKEVVLTGVHIGDYQDQDLRLEDLVQQILDQTKIQRIRLTSLEPIELSERLLSLYDNPRMCPHFHMSIQSASTPVLKVMKRNYGAEEVADAFRRIAKKLPHAFVGMDIIAGFPTETEEDFENTYMLLQETPWTRMHVFPYSERSGTRAAIMDQVPMHVRKARARRLRELSLIRYQETLKNQVGQIKETLFLKNSDLGLTHDYWNIRVPSASAIQEDKNKIAQVKVTAFDLNHKGRSEGVLVGELL